jgi:CO/xanthine dehydrogenase FAD-binding subunit
MKLPPFELRIARTRDEAVRQLAALGSDARILAGGQSLLPLLRYRLARPHVLVDITRIDDLRELQCSGETIRIGALATHADLERVGGDEPGAAALLRAHAREIAFRPIRTRGTAVGSIVHADPKGDWPLALLALDGRIELQSPRGTRKVALREFIAGPLDTSREVDELAIAVTLDAKRDARWGRSKLQHRAGEYAVCSAVAIEERGQWACWIGAAGDRPFALSTLEKLLGSAEAARSDVVAAAVAELGRMLPDASAVERHRHAVNLADAIDKARPPNDK